MKAAIYARSAIRDDESIKQQIEQCEKIAQSGNMHIQEIYVDNGVSGNGEKPQLNKMLSELNKFDFIIITKNDKLSRNAGELYNIKRKLEKNNILIFSFNQKE